MTYSRVIVLGRNTATHGTLTLTLRGNYVALGRRERDFLSDLLDRCDRYEKDRGDYAAYPREEKAP